MLKTKKGVAKRFRLTKKGKVKYHPCGTGHILTNKEPERLRKMRRATTLSEFKAVKFIKKMLPYG
jgi:large subunit ribosomal protein L35